MSERDETTVDVRAMQTSEIVMELGAFGALPVPVELMGGGK